MKGDTEKTEITSLNYYNEIKPDNVDFSLNSPHSFIHQEYQMNPLICPTLMAVS